jgi:hypothetical protein
VEGARHKRAANTDEKPAVVPTALLDMFLRGGGQCSGRESHRWHPGGHRCWQPPPQELAEQGCLACGKCAPCWSVSFRSDHKWWVRNCHGDEATHLVVTIPMVLWSQDLTRWSHTAVVTWTRWAPWSVGATMVTDVLTWLIASTRGSGLPTLGRDIVSY